MRSYVSATIANILSLLRPTFLRAGEPYSWRDLEADIVAGVTVAVVQIPQSMALALIAGLPAVYGLYASLPGCLASLWGSSRHLSTGPVAIVSFLTLTSLVPFAEPGTPEFIRLAALLALLVGLIYLLMGLFRLGFILQLVPHSVILGFSSAAGVIIVITQLPTLFGITVLQHNLVFENVAAIVSGLPTTSLLTVMIGLFAMAGLVLSRQLPRAFPSALIVLGIGVSAGYLFNLGGHGIALVREVPESLPSFSWPWIDAGTLLLLLPKAAIVALVGFVGTHASAKIAARKTLEHLNTDQELVGQGLANAAAGFFQGFPLGGSFTRTVINMEAGARSAVAAIATAAMTVIALLFFAPLFYHLPRAVLSAIVIIAAIPLVDIGRLRQMYHISKTDGVVAFLTLFMAFILRPEDAILLGIVAALTLFIRQTVWGAHVREMGIDRELNILRGAIEEGIVDTFPGVAIARIGMSVYYANAAHLVGEIDKLIARHVLREHAPVRTLVLDVSGVNFIDITAIEVLEEYFESLKERSIRVTMIYLHSSVRLALERVPNFPAFKILRNIADMRSSLWLAHK